MFESLLISHETIIICLKISTPLAAILSLTELIENSAGEFISQTLVIVRLAVFSAGTMFELVKALNDGAEVLKTRSSNPISINAGCELFIAFVTLFPHDSAVRIFRPVLI